MRRDRATLTSWFRQSRSSVLRQPDTTPSRRRCLLSPPPSPVRVRRFACNVDGYGLSDMYAGRRSVMCRFAPHDCLLITLRRQASSLCRVVSHWFGLSVGLGRLHSPDVCPVWCSVSHAVGARKPTYICVMYARRARVPLCFQRNTVYISTSVR